MLNLFPIVEVAMKTHCNNVFSYAEVIMKRYINDYVRKIAVVLIVGSLFTGTGVYAANDPSIRGEQRQNIIASMNRFIQEKTIGDTYRLYDAVGGKLLRLKFKKLHDGIVRKGDYYVSCADFVDQMGRTVDLDFLVMADGMGFKATQAVVHSVDGKKRKYHLE